MTSTSFPKCLPLPGTVCFISSNYFARRDHDHLLLSTNYRSNLKNALTGYCSKLKTQWQMVFSSCSTRCTSSSLDSSTEPSLQYFVSCFAKCFVAPTWLSYNNQYQFRLLWPSVGVAVSLPGVSEVSLSSSRGSTSGVPSGCANLWAPLTTTVHYRCRAKIYPAAKKYPPPVTSPSVLSAVCIAELILGR